MWTICNEAPNSSASICAKAWGPRAAACGLLVRGTFLKRGLGTHRVEKTMSQRKNEMLADSDFHNHVTFHPSYPTPCPWCNVDWRPSPSNDKINRGLWEPQLRRSREKWRPACSSPGNFGNEQPSLLHQGGAGRAHRGQCATQLPASTERGFTSQPAKE